MKRIARLSGGYFKNLQENKIQARFLFATRTTQAKPSLHLDWETTKKSIFNNLINQQKRGYAPGTSNIHSQCWNCQKEQEYGKGIMVCQHCSHLQDVQAEINYFKLLDFPQTFSLEPQALTKRFRELQSVVHPDKFSNKSSHEQSNSADWSSLINNAYKTLSNPLERGQYLLKLNGLQIPQNNSALNKEFLMEMMERNEEVDEANTKKELDNIIDSLNRELQSKVVSLTQAFSENNLETAKSLLVEMKYLKSIQKTIKNKLQNLLES